MKKFICVVGVTMMLISGCGNREVIDITYSYDSVIIKLPDETIVQGKIESWRDYDDGDQIQVKINGKTYLVHSSNVVLINN